MLRAIPCTVMRGGTSKGLFFAASDLPRDQTDRDNFLLAAMGSPDMRQIDGMGGAHPLTSKVAVISTSTREDADVDFLFLQVSVDRPIVSDGQTCGNILAAVGPWALEHGLAPILGDTSPVRIHMTNTKSIAIAHVPTPGGVVEYEGEACIDGVPGKSAGIPINFPDIAGSNCGALLPTGSVIDHVNGIDVTCIDNGMPVVLMRARDLGRVGSERPEALESDATLRKKIEAIRLTLGPRMNLGDVADKTVPKMTLVSPPDRGGSISTRSFIPHRVHEAIGVLGAISVATACMIPGSVAAGLAKLDIRASPTQINVEHPTGFFTVDIGIEKDGDSFRVRRSALLRTARKLMEGKIFVSSRAWEERRCASPL